MQPNLVNAQAISTAPVLGIIGGTSVYALSELEDTQSHTLETPFGTPSGPIRVGLIDSKRVAFLARHGESHALPPHRVNYRANLWALHALGVRRVLAINTVGGITESAAPRALVVPDQVIDYTHGRDATYWDGAGDMLHAEFAEPYGQTLRNQLLEAGRRVGIELVDGSCYGATQGPRFETVAEIRRMRIDGCDVVGMTGMPEAALARELGLDYACVAPVANWAAGCGDGAAISLDEVFANLAACSGQLPTLIRGLLATCE
ncbi:MAG: S-methyl-5'-thioinosine phosphorylase [Pseudomarimonas sp.]